MSYFKYSFLLLVAVNKSYHWFVMCKLPLYLIYDIMHSDNGDYEISDEGLNELQISS